MKYVMWIEPDENFDPIHKKVTIEEAVKTMKDLAVKKNFKYTNDDMALKDFMTLHWGWIEDES